MCTYVHSEERWLSCQCPMATISPSPAFSLNLAQLLSPSRYLINVCGMNGQTVLTCSVWSYVNNVILEYGKERYISSCNKSLQYLFILKEDGGEILEGKAEAKERTAMTGSYSNRVTTGPSHLPLLFPEPLLSTSYTCYSLFT